MLLTRMVPTLAHASTEEMVHGVKKVRNLCKSHAMISIPALIHKGLKV